MSNFYGKWRFLFGGTVLVLALYTRRGLTIIAVIIVFPSNPPPSHVGDR